MAGDWIPMRCDLPDDPSVIAMASALGMDEYAVIGRLLKLWSWANRHLPDGASSVATEWIDRFVSTPGFAAAMLKSGWLHSRSGGVLFPHFDRWNSKSAKRRLMKTQWQRSSRHDDEPTADDDHECGHSMSSKSPPEKRREEKSKDPPTPHGGGEARRPRKTAMEHHHFAGFWSAYPRKTARPKAVESFARIDPDDATFAAMLAALDRQRRSPEWCKDDGRYIPHPTTWLNQRRWEDLPPEVGKVGTPTMSSNSTPYEPYENFIPKPKATADDR